MTDIRECLARDAYQASSYSAVHWKATGTCTHDHWRRIVDAMLLRLALTQAQLDGLASGDMVVVPREMTPAMCEGFYRHACSVEPPDPNDFTSQVSKAWEATISAAQEEQP